jgi:hypothetical protein
MGCGVAPRENCDFVKKFTSVFLEQFLFSPALRGFFRFSGLCAYRRVIIWVFNGKYGGISAP